MITVHFGQCCAPSMGSFPLVGSPLEVIELTNNLCLQDRMKETEIAFTSNYSKETVHFATTDRLLIDTILWLLRKRLIPNPPDIKFVSYCNCTGLLKTCTVDCPKNGSSPNWKDVPHGFFTMANRLQS